MHTKILLVLGLGFWACLPSSLRAESAAELLDRAIWWPGDYGQLCRDDDSVGSFGSVPLRYGTLIHQEYFLSADTLAQLSTRRKEIVEELGLRLKTFHWENIPPAPPVSEEVRKLAAGVENLRGQQGEPIALPGPRTFDNPRALGGTMLRIMEALQTVELLPELLRLEEELGQINDKAQSTSYDPFRNNGGAPIASLPNINTGDEFLGQWEAEDSTEKDQPNRDAVVKWKQQLFKNRVFQREMLGVCLGMLEKKGYAPLLRDSLTARLHALGANRHPPGLLPDSKDVLDDARRLVRDFIAGKEPPAAKVDGVALLEESIASPGSFSQMCVRMPEIPLNAPLPAMSALAPRHYNLGGYSLIRLLAYRDVVLPVLVGRIQELKIAAPAPEKKTATRDVSERIRSGQTSTEFGPLIFQVVEHLNAVECLPGLLRLEQQLHDLVAAAEKDAKVAVPLLRLDSPFGWSPVERERALQSCRIYQREMLGLMHTLLMQEGYPPMRDSALEKSMREAGRAAFRREHAAEVAKFTSYEQIPSYLRSDVVWDEVKRKAEISEDASYAVGVPYSEAVRDEVLKLTQRFLQEVPPEKRKAADGMPLPWYSSLFRK